MLPETVPVYGQPMKFKQEITKGWDLAVDYFLWAIARETWRIHSRCLAMCEPMQPFITAATTGELG